MNIQEQIEKSEEKLPVYLDGVNSIYIYYVKSWHRNSIKSILEGLVEREKAENNGYTAPDCNDPFLVEQGFSIAKQNTISHLEYLIKSLE